MRSGVLMVVWFVSHSAIIQATTAKIVWIVSQPAGLPDRFLF